MSHPEDIVQRWKANTKALGIRLTDEDIERISAGSLGARHTAIDDVLNRTHCMNVVPDFLADTRKAESGNE